MSRLTRLIALAAALLTLGAASAVAAVAQPGDMSLGNPKAAIQVVEYASLSCPHCAHFNADVFQAFKAKYLDTGRAYFTMREFLTPPANVAAAGWLLASLGVYVRDVGQITGVIVLAMLYTSGVFFPIEQMKPNVQAVMRLNPLTMLIVQARDVLLWGLWPDWLGLASYTGIAFVACWLAYVWFQRTRAGFIDVL